MFSRTATSGAAGRCRSLSAAVVASARQTIGGLIVWSDISRGRHLIMACGVLGPLMLAAYFTAPLLASHLSGVLYAAHPTTFEIVDAGRRYHELLNAGTWLQATGALLAVVFFLALADITGHGRSLAARITQAGSAVLLAVVLAEAVFTLTWASTAVNGLAASSRTSFDLMSTFIRVFPIVPAPALYLSVGWLLLGSRALPRAFAQLALVLGAAFAIIGLIAVFVPAASAATAGLSGLQVLWIIAAAITLYARTGPGREPTAPQATQTRTSGDEGGPKGDLLSL